MKSRKDKKSKPFLDYGAGIENFFNLEVALIKIFGVLTLIAIPQMAIFASYNSYSSYSNNAWFNVLSFGSLGQANTFCSKVPNIVKDS